jgi:hypothetical protein
LGIFADFRQRVATGDTIVSRRACFQSRANDSRYNLLGSTPMTTILQEAAAGRATIVAWTVEQYHRAIETGFVLEDTAVELIDGFIVHKDRAEAGKPPMTIGDRHRIAVLRLAQFAPAFERLGCFLQTQQPISLPPINEPEPDGAAVRGGIDD